MERNQRQKITIFFVIALSVRLLLYIFLYSRGYFYGKPWDTFSRTLLSFYWSIDPFFAPSDGYWLPLQFWINGLVFMLVKPFYPYSNLVIPILINNLWFIGSLLISYKILSALTQDNLFSSLSLWILSFFSADIFISFSGLSEPMLIFFMLISSYCFYQLITTNQKRYIVAISFISLLASATHYIGWFLSLFFIIYFSGLILLRYLRYKKVNLIEFFPILSSLIMPATWLINAYLKFGSPLYPFQFAQNMQQPYMGQMAYWIRFLSIPKVMFFDIGVISIYGIIAICYLFLRRDIRIMIVIPSIFVLSVLWMSTIVGSSNPFQETRYLVFWGWTVFPVVAYLSRNLLKHHKTTLTIIAVSGLLLIYFIQNSIQLIRYENSFDRNLVKVAAEIRPWCLSITSQFPAIIISNSFAESGVLPLLSGCPDKLTILTKNEFLEKASRLYNKHKCSLIITKSKSLVKEIFPHQMDVKKVNRYFIVVCNPSDTSESLPRRTLPLDP